MLHSGEDSRRASALRSPAGPSTTSRRIVVVGRNMRRHQGQFHDGQRAGHDSLALLDRTVPTLDTLIDAGVARSRSESNGGGACS